MVKPLRRHLGFFITALITCAAPAGCQTPQTAPLHLVAIGDYGRARVEIRDHLTEKRNDRAYLLDRMRLAILTLADGYPQAAQNTFEQLYELLRTQGINKNKTVESVVINEDLKIWKGEPFEQAMAMLYYALQQAELGHWDNARAAADNSLFNLKDFGKNDKGEPMDAEEIARQSLVWERTHKSGENPDEAGKNSDYFNSGYAVRESNFTLGHLINGLANQQLDRDDEANDNFAVALQINPDLQPLVDELKSRQYNTILMVSWGLGPVKVAYGPDGALARFQPRYPSDNRPLVVRIEGDERRHLYPVALDLNAMADDHMWNNLEDVRQAKSFLGNTFLLGGGAATYYGAGRGNDEALYAGLGAMAAGLFMKAGAHADTRYCDVMPQRMYLVPLRIDDPRTVVELQVEGEPGSRMVLAAMPAPDPASANLRYVRLVSGGPVAHPPGGGDGAGGATPPPPGWAVSGRIFYGNDATGPASDKPLPYILGGDCVRIPSEQVLDSYQAGGNLSGFTLGELADLYHAENIKWDVDFRAGRHVLEGGRWLDPPLVGTAGFTRIFGQRHPPYAPQSDLVKQTRIATPMMEHNDAPQ